jgi:hypothetical protein
MWMLNKRITVYHSTNVLTVRFRSFGESASRENEQTGKDSASQLRNPRREISVEDGAPRQELALHGRPKAAPDHRCHSGGVM